MEGSRGKGFLPPRGCAASRIAGVGKENICPALSSKEHLSESRSPLPEGFPRAPLQDITHILSPINILPNDDDGDATDCWQGRKRSKCVLETQTSRCITRSECEPISSEAWRGLRKCATLQAANSEVHVTGESKLTKDVANENLAHLTENTKLTESAKLTEDSVAAKEMLVSRERRDTEVLKSDVAEATSTKTKPKRSLRLSGSTSSTRSSLRSSQEKQKISSLMKFR